MLLLPIWRSAKDLRKSSDSNERIRGNERRTYEWCLITRYVVVYLFVFDMNLAASDYGFVYTFTVVFLYFLLFLYNFREVFEDFTHG